MQRTDLRGIVGLLVIAPESQLDKSMVELVKKWSDPPTALQVLEVLDKIAHSALASEFIVGVLEDVLYILMREEGVSLEELAKKAHWRASLN